MGVGVSQGRYEGPVAASWDMNHMTLVGRPKTDLKSVSNLPFGYVGDICLISVKCLYTMGNP